MPVGQLFFPPYLFARDGARAERPVILKAPDRISYRAQFDIAVEGGPDRIASVAILRSDHNTHSLTTGDRYVKLAFRRMKGAGTGDLLVRGPRLPAQAIPGI